MANSQVAGVSMAALVGPSARYVWDVADRSRSGWAVPMGVSGDPDGPHGREQFDAWRTGRLFPVFEGS
jgi:penicillin amidase